MSVRVCIICEGQTEETFVRELLTDHFARYSVYITPFNLKGGATYGFWKRNIERLCKQDPTTYFTSLIDLYGLPKDFPKFQNDTNPCQKVKAAETAFAQDVNQRNFIPNLVLHEFEALLFSDVTKFQSWFGLPSVLALGRDAENFTGPEHVNDGKETAPSKRVLKACTSYKKRLHGPLIAQEITLDVIRDKCPHFDGWIKKIETLKA